jgi:hypothetical protein
MMIVRGCRFQRVNIRRHGSLPATGMVFRHPHFFAVTRHFLTAFPLRGTHHCSGNGTGHHRQRNENYRQRDNPDLFHECQPYDSSRSFELDATQLQGYPVTDVTRLESF